MNPKETDNWPGRLKRAEKTLLIDRRVTNDGKKLVSIIPRLVNFCFGGAFACKIYSRRYMFLGFGRSFLGKPKPKFYSFFQAMHGGHRLLPKCIQVISGPEVLRIGLTDIMCQKPKSYSLFFFFNNRSLF